MQASNFEGLRLMGCRKRVGQSNLTRKNGARDHRTGAFYGKGSINRHPKIARVRPVLHPLRVEG